MPEPAAVAARVAEIIRANPARHNQALWVDTPRATTGDVLTELDTGACETTGCAAGWAVIVASPPGTTWRHAADNDIFWLVEGDSGPVEIRDAATGALGLSNIERDWIFDYGRTTDEVLAALDDIAAGNRSAIPDEPYDGYDDEPPF